MGIEAFCSSPDGGNMISVPTEGSKCPNMRRYLRKDIKLVTWTLWLVESVRWRSSVMCLIHHYCFEKLRIKLGKPCSLK